MSFFYDLHLHSCLSPCGDEDMTPFNLVNMAKLSGLDIIALTDHNSARNCPGAIEAGKEADILVIPGMELCTAEEIHVICLFPNLQAALSFDTFVYSSLPRIENRSEIFGKQLILNHRDKIIEEENLLLLNASSIRIDELPSLMKSYGGVSYPAHIDRESFSILSVLGEFPLDIGFSAFEISTKGDKDSLLKRYPPLKELINVTSSDAHYLENISTPRYKLPLREATAKEVIEYLSATNLLDNIKA